MMRSRPVATSDLHRVAEKATASLTPNPRPLIPHIGPSLTLGILIGGLLCLCANTILAAAPATQPARTGYTYDHGAIVRGTRDRKRLALIFTGDKYGEGATAILDALKTHKAGASFFVTGNYIRTPEYAGHLKRIVAEGHYLGPHSDGHLLYCPWEDRNKTLVTEEDFRKDLDKNLADLSAFGRKREEMRFFIPPFEWYNDQIAGWAKKSGLILFNMTPGTRSHTDYMLDKDPHFIPSKKIHEGILEYEAKNKGGLNGFLLLLHLGSGPERTDKMHPHVEPLLAELSKRGYQFVRVNELLNRAMWDIPPVRSSWDDLTDGIQTAQQWQYRKEELRDRFLELLRDDQKPARPPLDLQVHETVTVDNVYVRKLISYNVEADERAHAYLAIPIERKGPLPAIVALHGTFPRGKERTAGLVDNPEKAHLDHLARRGYIVIAPDHFVAGDRIPPEGAYVTERFYRKHPEWTAVGKFTYEHSIAVDVLASLPEVKADSIGVLGHSLGGQGTMFLAAYDARIKAAACNCAAPTFRHNARVEDWARDYWYSYFRHLRPDIMDGRLPPIDMHEITALIAPRAYLDLFALNDGDPLTQSQRTLMNLAIMKVYELEGVPQNFAFFVHGRGHSVAHESRELFHGWMDTHLKTGER